MESTVSAISTPHGRGGIAVIRISGPRAIEIADKMFKRQRGTLRDVPSQGATYGKILLDGNVIDDGMATVFRAPRSFTGEDTVEISCHGGVLISLRVLEATFKAGAEPAGPGEFTKRAFINGKLGLSEAEAVIASINAENDEQLMLARSHVEGTLSKELSEISKELIKIVSSCFVLCDYPDEDLADVTPDEMLLMLKSARARLEALYSSYKRGHAVREGINTVIIGKPNVGKSSLLNKLLGYDRAIVTDIAGTTRDTVEEELHLGKVLIKLCDTAGIRDDSSDAVERIGIKRSLEKLDSAELILSLFDTSSPVTEEDREIIERVTSRSAPKIAIFCKSDKERDAGFDRSAKSEIEEKFDNTVTLSTVTGEGIDELKTIVENMFAKGDIDYRKTPVIANSRQKAAVGKALDAVDSAINALKLGLTTDMVGLDVEAAIAALNETDKRSVSAEVVDEIFHGFCVGK